MTVPYPIEAKKGCGSLFKQDIIRLFGNIRQNLSELAKYPFV